MQAKATAAIICFLSIPCSAETATYRQLFIEDTDSTITRISSVAETVPPRWARGVAMETYSWPAPREEPVFTNPISFVIPPSDPGEPFYSHNHQPSVTWLENGDLMAIYYTTNNESGTELTVLASRLRRGAKGWDPSSAFLKAPHRNMHGSSLFKSRDGTLHHFNGVAPEDAKGWSKLALLHRSSRDLGVTWTEPRAVCPTYQARQQAIHGGFQTRGGVLVQPCDAVPGANGGSNLQLSRDEGKTWNDSGAGKSVPDFKGGGSGRGTIAGIHAGVVELKNGDFLALGRGDTIQGQMPMSISRDQGETWNYSTSPFTPLGGGQRLVLIRLREGPLLLVSFTCTDRQHPRTRGMEFLKQDGSTFRGYGMFAAISEDEGRTWPVRKLITAGSGEHDGGAWTGKFTASPDNAEHAGYLAATQSPDGIIHLLSSALHYRFNLPWIKTRAGNP